MHFEDRSDAARQLAQALRAYRGKGALVLAIPRGAVPMGRIVAEELAAELDVVLVHKLGAPMNEEFAVGAVDETGWTYIPDYARELGFDERKLERVRRQQMEVMRQRRARYTPEREPVDPKGRTCIIVDDGLATGSTMVAAIHSVRARGAAKIVCAVPVAAPDSLASVRKLADEVVCLHAPWEFHAVGQFYHRFDQVSDEEVLACLSTAGSSHP
ncbi:MAG TPA: phosphoribosyltransferase family protein [Usitatibacter sp.]|nr:phosphoribosyltransferase family protein [Usitatibacter sp.]